MSPDAFFAWQEAQAERYELVGGVPVRMMAGARNVQDDIVVNILAGLRPDLRGSGCRSFTGDGRVETLPGRSAAPLSGSVADPRSKCAEGGAATAGRRGAVAEHPRLRCVETLGEYRTFEDLEHILLVESNAAELRLWTRDPDRLWAETRLLGLEAMVRLSAFGIAMPAAEIDEDVAFPNRAHFVADERDGPAG